MLRPHFGKTTNQELLESLEVPAFRYPRLGQGSPTTGYLKTLSADACKPVELCMVHQFYYYPETSTDLRSRQHQEFSPNLCAATHREPCVLTFPCKVCQGRCRLGRPLTRRLCPLSCSFRLARCPLVPPHPSIMPIPWCWSTTLPGVSLPVTCLPPQF